MLAHNHPTTQGAPLTRLVIWYPVKHGHETHRRHRNEQVQLHMTKGPTPGIDHRESRCGTKRKEKHFDGEDYTKQQGELFDKNLSNCSIQYRKKKQKKIGGKQARREQQASQMNHRRSARVYPEVVLASPCFMERICLTRLCRLAAVRICVMAISTPASLLIQLRNSTETNESKP